MHGRFVRKRRISTEFLRESKLLLDEKPGHNMLIRGKVKIISFFATKKKKRKKKKHNKTKLRQQEGKLLR